MKSENWGVREEVSEFTKSLKNIVERMKINELNFNELCKEKSNLKNKRQPQKSKLSEGKGDWEIDKWKYNFKEHPRIIKTGD